MSPRQVTGTKFAVEFVYEKAKVVVLLGVFSRTRHDRAEVSMHNERAEHRVALYSEAVQSDVETSQKRHYQ